MIRRPALVAALALAAATLALPGSSPASARPASYHTIKSAHAGAGYSETVGCLRTDVFVSSARAMYAAQPGPVGKQGLTALAVRVVDVCASPARAVGAAAGPPEAVLFDGLGQVSVAPTVAPRLASARVSAVVPLVDDVSGATVPVTLRASWAASGPLQHDTVRNNVRFPQAGSVHAHDNNLMRPATATIAVAGAGIAASGTTTDASLELIRSRCMEVRWPHYDGESTWCFGFPG